MSSSVFLDGVNLGHKTLLGSVFSTFQWFVGITIITIVLSVLYRLTLHPLASYPGPKLWAASRIPFVVFSIRGTLPYKIAELHEKYGPVIRIAPDELSYTKAEAWTDIYAMSRPQLKKDPAMGAFSRNKKGVSHSIVLTESDDDHARMRRNFSHSFSEKALREQEPLITKYFDMFIQRLHDNSHSPVNITPWFNFVSFDIIGDLTFGESLECLEKSALHIWVENIVNRVKMLIYTSNAYRLSPLDKLLPFFISNQAKAKAGIHMQFIDSKIKQRLSIKGSRPDFMTHAQEYLDTPTGMTFAEIRATSSTFVIAGSESTATLLSGLTYHLLTNPSKLAKLVQEIRSTFSSESEITMISVNTLKYQLACINEGLRIFPVVPNSISRVTPKEGTLIFGKFVPGNTLVGINQWATSHSPANFHLPYTFAPERWLDQAPSSPFANDSRKSSQPFSVGPRNCIGRNLAMAEMRVILARLLWNFDIELCDESRNWIDVEEMMPRVYALWEKGELWVRLRRAVR